MATRIANHNHKDSRSFDSLFKSLDEIVFALRLSPDTSGKSFFSSVSTTDSAGGKQPPTTCRQNDTPLVSPRQKFHHYPQNYYPVQAQAMFYPDYLLLTSSINKGKKEVRRGKSDQKLFILKGKKINRPSDSYSLNKARGLPSRSRIGTSIDSSRSFRIPNFFTYGCKI